RQVCVICSATSVDWDSTSHGVLNLDAGRFSIVTADAGTDIRLELLISRRESQNEVRQERTSVNPSGHVPLASRKNRRAARARREHFVQGEVSPASEAIIKEISFNGWPNPARPKDVTEFEAAEETDVILRVHFESRSEKW